MKTALLILQSVTVAAVAVISGETVAMLCNTNLLLAIYSWGISIPVIYSYIKKTDKSWFNKEDHHA